MKQPILVNRETAIIGCKPINKPDKQADTQTLFVPPWDLLTGGRPQTVVNSFYLSLLGTQLIKHTSASVVFVHSLSLVMHRENYLFNLI